MDEPDYTGKFLDNGKYEVIRLIDHGGNGDVYEGIQTFSHPGAQGGGEKGARVAIKIFRRDAARNEDFRTWFQEDAEKLKRLEHPNLIKYRAFAYEPRLSRFYVATDYVDGPSLYDILSTTHANTAQLLKLIKVLAEAIGKAHKQGLLHFDLCPEHILLPQGDMENPKVINFGVPTRNSLKGREAFTAVRIFSSRFAYAAPEQFSDEVIGSWTDVYSLALVILAVAAGKPPPMGTNLADAVASRRAIPDLSSLPEELRPLFTRMLALNPAERIRSMNEVVSEIESISAPPPEPEAQEPQDVTGLAPSLPNYVGANLNGIYEVEEFIARGGMGEVYKGAAIDSGETVAIKIVLPELATDPNVQRMFRQEARALMQLHHPGVVQYRLFARDRDLGVYYIVTEFVDGKTLSDALPSLEITSEQIRSLMRRLAEALSLAHSLGIVHRDLCPDNVLLPRDSLDHAKLIDFGIAKRTATGAETFFTTQGGFLGRLGYSAPEQFSGQPIGPWTDVYSLALVILAVAAKAHPRMGTNIRDAVDYRMKVPDLSALPEEFRPLFERMLAPNPRDRIQSMEEVCAGLVGSRPAVEAATVIPVPPVSAVETPRESPPRQSVPSAIPGEAPTESAPHLPVPSAIVVEAPGVSSPPQPILSDIPPDAPRETPSRPPVPSAIAVEALRESSPPQPVLSEIPVEAPRESISRQPVLPDVAAELPGHSPPKQTVPSEITVAAPRKSRSRQPVRSEIPREAPPEPPSPHPIRSEIGVAPPRKPRSRQPVRSEIPPEAPPEPRPPQPNRSEISVASPRDPSPRQPVTSPIIVERWHESSLPGPVLPKAEVEAPPTSAVSPAEFRTSRRRLIAFGSAAALVAVVATALLLWQRQPLPAIVAPKLLRTSPATNSVDVPTGTDLQLTFDENVKSGSGSIVVHKSSDGNVATTIATSDASQVRFDGATVTINPTDDLAEGTDYYVVVPPGALTSDTGEVYAGLTGSADLHFRTALPALEEVRRRLEGAVAGMTCRWLNLDYPDSRDQPSSQMRVVLSGLAGEPIAARADAMKQAVGTSVPLNIDTNGVWPVQSTACEALDAFARFREPLASTARALAVSQSQYVLGRPDNCPPREMQAEVIVTLPTGSPSSDFSLIVLLSDGRMQQALRDRAQFDQVRRQNPNFARDLGNNVYEVSFCTDVATARESRDGRFGLVLLHGAGPFSLALRENGFAAAQTDWPQRFTADAMAKGWTTEMAWYEVAEGFSRAQ